MTRAISNLRTVFIPALRGGLWIGGLAYTYVLVFAGWPTLGLGRSAVGSEILIGFQYLAMGLLFTLGVALVTAPLTAMLRRDLSVNGFTAACTGSLVFAAIFLPADLAWLLAHRPIDPLSSSFLTASLVFVLIAAVMGLGAFMTVLRLGEITRLGWRGRIRTLSFIVLVLLGSTSRLLLLDRPGRDSSGRSRGERLVIIGMDGATWNLIDPMMARGELPNLERLVRRGASGPLTSLEPIESPRVWTSIATGKLPEKHGIEEFLVDRRFIRTRTLWDILESSGYRVGLYDWLVTYPPQSLDGFVIPGWLAGGKKLTHPPGLGGSLFLVRVLRHPAWFARTVLFRLLPGYLDEARGNPLPRAINSEFAMADMKILDLPYLRAVYDPGVLAVVFYGSDVLAHMLWQYMEPHHFEGVDPGKIRRYGGVLPEYYRKVDEAIGLILSLYDDDTTFLVVSDHGSRAADGVQEILYINADALLREMGLGSVAHVVGSGGGESVALISVDGVVDRTSGAVSGDGSAADLTGAILEALNSLRSASTGDQVFLASLEGEKAADIRLGLHPGLDLSRGHSVRIGDRRVDLARFFRPAVISGDHTLEGILILKGPDVREGIRIERSSVLDITPTVLYLRDIAAGRDMDGRALTAALTEERVASRPLRLIESHDLGHTLEPPPDRPEVDEELIERLQSLGYLK